ncbi:MAG: GNAT family N-acetyltransferase [Rhodospirillaceae bacterium]|nr:GNAT family N-acetyltransferase [Rhodospirillaceae bacterium]
MRDETMDCITAQAAPEPLTGELIKGFSDLSPAERAVLSGACVENADYLALCEEGAPGNMTLGAAVVRRGGETILAVPVLCLSYRLDTPLQGRFERFGQWLRRLAPSLVEWRLFCVGSPFTENCPLLFRGGLSRAERHDAFRALMATVEKAAIAAKASLTAFKDLAEDERKEFGALLTDGRYNAIRSLPTAVLDLSKLAPEGGQDAYFSSLSRTTRKDIKRKLKSRDVLRIEHRKRIDDIAQDITALYQSTQANSEVRYGDFEELPQGYFESVSCLGPDRVHYILYWVGEHLAAFNLLFLEKDRVIDKFLGMRYPLARHHNIYAVSWMENVDFTLKTGRLSLQSGQTAYASKLRFKSELQPLTIYARHRNAFVNRLIYAAADLAAFDRWDPDLRGLRKKAGKRGGVHSQ